MTQRICVFGLWHLGCVTAACLARAGFDVVGLDFDSDAIAVLQRAEPPIAEPGLADLIASQLATGRLTFTSDPAQALTGASVLWVTFDTPVDADDEAHPEWVRAQLELARPFMRPGTLVVVSAQVPVGFSRALAADWASDTTDVQVICSPENLQLGRAIDAFSHPDRIVVGGDLSVDRDRFNQIVKPFSESVEWMSLESAEMTKHAINGFLAVSIAYTNELARLAERVGADAQEVERGLRTEPRIGRRAYVSPGPPISGGTLARDIAFLHHLGTEHGLGMPLVDAVRVSNAQHQAWTRAQIDRLLQGVLQPRVTLLGLTYKAGTDTLRRSAAVDLAIGLNQAGVAVRAYDPAVRTLPPELQFIELGATVASAIHDADVAVLTTGWPEFRDITGDDVVREMRQPHVVDQAGFLTHLSDDSRLTYVRVGQPRRSAP